MVSGEKSKKEYLLFYRLIYSLCVREFCLHDCLCIMCILDVQGSQKRESDSQEMELTVLNYHVHVENKPRSSGKKSVFNHWPISSSPRNILTLEERDKLPFQRSRVCDTHGSWVHNVNLHAQQFHLSFHVFMNKDKPTWLPFVDKVNYTYNQKPGLTGWRCSSEEGVLSRRGLGTNPQTTAKQRH